MTGICRDSFSLTIGTIMERCDIPPAKRALGFHP
jgi:hypothetical protein